MRKYWLFGALIITSGCGAVAPTAPESVTKAVVAAEAEPLSWPVLMPNGGEDPRYAPPPCACPVGFTPHYNNFNFICRKPGGAAFEVVLPNRSVKSCS